MEYEPNHILFKNYPRLENKRKRPEFTTKKTSLATSKWRDKNPDKYNANTKKSNNKQALRRSKIRLSKMSSMSTRNHKPEIIRLYLKGRDISYIVTYTNLPSSIILKVLNDYNASIK